jgi:hypothetical protein
MCAFSNLYPLDKYFDWSQKNMFPVVSNIKVEKLDPCLLLNQILSANKTKKGFRQDRGRVGHGGLRRNAPFGN